ncbi:hypothetical protein [Maritimibacter dapengensis]|uniref:Uncharacterized protein n=1 Tax=Maritimibacter dapengensis TaxID=2836868 RepID=A0ABS6SZ20_9RHOB|nr:hypothetical protein [Maritimibacter dapengensis]MBV7377387.1 hypothetical protein [Maritimibacter dapengensis]
MTLSIATEHAEPMNAVPETMTDGPIIEKIRRGRLAALAALRARTAQTENVVSIFDTAIETRISEPVFRSRRSGSGPRPSKLLLTRPILA